jgi:hypothetical protein
MENGNSTPFRFFVQTPYDGEQVTTFAGANQAALLQCLYSAGVGIRGANHLIVFQTAQNGIATARIGFELVPVFQLSEQVSFAVAQFRSHTSFLRRHRSMFHEISAQALTLFTPHPGRGQRPGPSLYRTVTLSECAQSSPSRTCLKE